MDYSDVISVLAGALGALTADLTHDNALTAPRWRQGRLYMGSLGPLILGAVAGAVMTMATTAPLAALAAGFCGRRWLPGLMTQMLAPAETPAKEKKA